MARSVDGLVLAEGAAGLQEFVDEGGFPVVDVGDDGEVADGIGGHEGGKDGLFRGFRKQRFRFSGQTALEQAVEVARDLAQGVAMGVAREYA